LKVSISACQGHGNCYTHCPDVFVPDVEGYATLAVEIVPAGLEADVLAAEAACPEHAITASRVAAEEVGSTSG
jgi:ferredoxin